MMLNRRQATGLMIAGAATNAFPLRMPAFANSDVHRSHGASLVGDLKYPADFKRYDYIDPDAPKGGEARLAALGGYDSFNPYIVKGDSAVGVSLIYDTLMTPPLDASSTEYGLLAEWIEYPKDFSWVAFKMRENALWHDGVPVTPEDAIFSFNLLTTKGAPLYRLYWANVEKATDEGDGILRFAFDTANNRELPHIMSQLPVLPAHYWKDRDFTKSSLDKPLGSGPYEIGEFEPGRFVVFDRVSDYWGKDLPVNIGQHNFNQLRFEYFKDPNAAFDAFKAGHLDFRMENSSLSWATKYDFPAVKNGDVRKEAVEVAGPKAVQSFVFNLRRPQFQDRRVREALAMAFDFEWTNEAVFFGQYGRPTSYFEGTPDLMASGVPEGAELEILEEYRDALPPELFEQPFSLPVSDGSGRPDRKVLRRQKKLLQEAGWTVKDGKLVNGKDEPFKLEFLIGSKISERVVQPFLKNLERLGIETKLRLVDSAQYVRRAQEHDFDMMVGRVQNSASPGNEQREYWGSKAVDAPGSRNVSGVSDPVVDALIERIIFSTDREDLAAASRALDRVLLWGYYGSFELHEPNARIAWWPVRVTKPEQTPSHDIGFPTVWWSAEAEG